MALKDGSGTLNQSQEQVSLGAGTLPSEIGLGNPLSKVQLVYPEIVQESSLMALLSD